MTKANTTKAATRYYVHTTLSGIGNKIANPHRVVERSTGATIDEYKSKHAANSHARELNRTTKEPK